MFISLIIFIRYFKRYSAFFLEFLPKILFFLLLFGYMMVLFFIKWIKYGAANESSKQNQKQLLKLY